MDTKRTIPQHMIWIGLLLLWAFLMLACNMPLIEPDAPLQPPTRSSSTAVPDTENENSLPATATLENGGATDNDNSAESTAPVLIATTTPRVTPSGVVTTSPDDADTTEEGDTTDEETDATTGELTLSYELTWRFDENDKNYVWADVILTVTGGDGNYSFYRDEKPTSGAEFEYRWGSCRTNPGSFRVESGDGQTAKIDYLETPLCSE